MNPFISRVLTAVAFTLFMSAGLTACGDDEVSSDEQARRAYLGLDESVSKALQLGFAGFNAASSANIPAQSAPGGVSGTLFISGQVDQGASTNKGMRLRVGMATYSGTLKGPFQMTGDLEGEVTLDLTLAGEIEDDGTGKVRRKVGTTTVTGTATSGDGSYNVNLTR